MRIKDDRMTNDGASNLSGQTYGQKNCKSIEDTISETCEKANRQLASLRLEVNDLSNRLHAKDKEFLALKEEMAALKGAHNRTSAAIKLLAIRELSRKEMANRREKAYHRFFCGNIGLLYRLGHILSAFSQLSSKVSPTAHDMLKAFSPFINLANNLTVLDTELSRLALNAVVAPDNSVDELLCRLNTIDEECFYTKLWHVCEAPLRRLCDQTRDEGFEDPKAYNALMVDVKDLLTNLRSCDIAVIPAPGYGFDTFFDNSKNETTPSRPLVMRVSNRYVYTRGLYNKLKPYTPWE